MAAFDEGTAGRYMNAWLQRSRHRLSPRTLEAYRWALEHYAAALLARPLATWSENDVRALLDELAGRLEGNTVLSARTALLALCRDAIDAGVLERNPVAAVPPRRYRPRATPRKVLGPDELEAVLGVARGTALEAPLLLMARAALRPGEVLGLHGDDVDLATRTAIIRHKRARSTHAIEAPKGGRVRTVDLSRQTVEALAHLPLGPGLVFPNLSHERLERGLARLCRVAGVPRVTPHSFRHACCSALLASGAPLQYVQRLAGHADPRITVGVYGSHLPNRNLAAVDALDGNSPAPPQEPRASKPATVVALHPTRTPARRRRVHLKPRATTEEAEPCDLCHERPQAPGRTVCAECIPAAEAAGRELLDRLLLEKMRAHAARYDAVLRATPCTPTPACSTTRVADRPAQPHRARASR